VSKPWNPGRKTVELAPSRIRREPVRLDTKVTPPSPEREIWMTVTGVVLVAIACAALAIGIAYTTLMSDDPAPPPPAFGHCYNQGGPNCVVDGDTIYFAGEKVEIAGMDAPEIRGAHCEQEANRGIQSAVRLVELLDSGPVTVSGALRDLDGQIRRTVEVDGRNVAQRMIDAGAARELGSANEGWCS
jgi:endonuclease YncB( thermonuclease family)